MRKILSLVAASAGLVLALGQTPAKAGHWDDFVCWMQPSGIMACAFVNEPYRVRDIPGKPHRHRDIRKCNHCFKDFKLTHRNINDFGRYTDNTTMRRYHDATLFGDKVRPVHD